MNESDYKEDADRYDEQVKEYDSYAQDVLFGLCYEFVKPGEKILDLGIGTGLASINFSRIGLKVYGLDRSEEMLNKCREKGFAEDLRIHNLADRTIPFDNDYFDHIICCGVLHFLGDLDNIFSEAARLMKGGGLFAFTVIPGIGADYKKEMTDWGVPVYKHPPEYIKKLLYKNGMVLIKEQRLLTKGADKVNYDIMFSVMIVKIHKQS